MEHLIRILITRLINNGMEITLIPAFIRNVANSIVANPSLSLEAINGHLHSFGWDDFDLDVYTFYLIMAILESDPIDVQIPSLDPIFN